MGELIKTGGDIPKEWFQFVSVRRGKGVRVGLTNQFERDLGDKRDDVLNTMQAIAHFTCNPHPSYSESRIEAEQTRINEIVQNKIGFTVDEISARRVELERDFNSQPDPVQAGIESGISRLLRKSEEKK